jgi:uncharacterized membrane protein YdjX (TVP38/TMEM64 family)
MARSQRTKPKFWLRMLLSMGVVMGVAIAFKPLNLQTLLQGILLWIENLGAIGIFAFILIYNLATIFLIPGALLTLGGGMLYGVFWGSVYVMIASTLGAVIAFWVGRYFARGWVYQQIQKHFTNAAFSPLSFQLAKLSLWCNLCFAQRLRNWLDWHDSRNRNVRLYRFFSRGCSNFSNAAE